MRYAGRRKFRVYRGVRIEPRTSDILAHRATPLGRNAEKSTPYQSNPALLQYFGPSLHFLSSLPYIITLRGFADWRAR